MAEDTRTKVENQLDNLIDSLATGLGKHGANSFCVTHKISQRSNAAAWKFALPAMLGYKAEIMSILQYNITTAQDAAETLDVGELDGVETAYVAAAPVPVVAIGGSQRLALVAGATGYTAIPQNKTFVVRGTSAGTVGVADYAITIRYYR